jgi:hypothetical protein
MYVPVLKNRQYENKFLRENKLLFYSEVSPLIEIISLKVGKKRYGEVAELIKMYDDALTCNFFIDFFVFGPDEYKEFDPNQVIFSLGIREETNYEYFDLLKIVAKSKNGVPVISLKTARTFLKNIQLLKIQISDLQKQCRSIAIRLESKVFDDYFDFIHPLLRKNDFLFYDINEEEIQSKYFDIRKMKSVKKDYKLLVQFSSRPRKIKNGSYPDGEFTKLIDNSLRENYQEYGFDGFSDYAGLKNVLPTNGGNGRGAALGLFYVNEKNSFFSIKNKNVDLGVKGHSYVIDQALNKYNLLLNPQNDCPCFDFIANELKIKGASGSWGQWKYITVLRYISQIKKSLQSDHL